MLFLKRSTQLTTAILAVVMATSTVAVSTTAQAKADGNYKSCKKYSKNWKGKSSSERKQARQERRLKRMTKKLSLSERQVEQIKAIYRNSQLEKKAVRQQMKPLYKELRQKRKANASFDQLEQTQEKLSVVRKQFRKVKYNQRQAMKRVLTAEQAKKFAKMGYKYGKGTYKMTVTGY